MWTDCRNMNDDADARTKGWVSINSRSTISNIHHNMELYPYKQVESINTSEIKSFRNNSAP